MRLAPKLLFLSTVSACAGSPAPRPATKAAMVAVAPPPSPSASEPAPAPAASGAAEGEQLSLAERVYVASELYSFVGMYFAHGEAVPGLNLDAAYRRYLDEVVAAPDRRAFDLASVAFVAQLHNGHSWFMDQKIGKPWNNSLGFRARPLGKQWVVTTSRLATIRQGQVLTAIDGASPDAFFDRVKGYISASSDRAARFKMFWPRMVYPATFSVMLDGKTQVTIDRASQVLAPPTPYETTGRWIDDKKTAYVKVPGFDETKLEERAVAFTQEYDGAKALIVDVRGNGGGNTPSRLIHRLMDRPWRSWSESTPLRIAVARAYTAILDHADLPPEDRKELGWWSRFASPQIYWPSDVEPAEAGAWKGKLFLLVDGDCASACEDFVVPFKDNKRATLVGEATQGSSGLPFVHGFDNGITVAVGAKRERMPDGSPFEGVGIAPDVVVEPTAADVGAKRDPVLDRAVALARAGAGS